MTLEQTYFETQFCNQTKTQSHVTDQQTYHPAKAVGAQGANGKPRREKFTLGSGFDVNLAGIWTGGETGSRNSKRSRKRAFENALRCVPVRVRACPHSQALYKQTTVEAARVAQRG